MFSLHLYIRMEQNGKWNGKWNGKRNGKRNEKWNANTDIFLGGTRTAYITKRQTGQENGMKIGMESGMENGMSFGGKMLSFRVYFWTQLVAPSVSFCQILVRNRLLINFSNGPIQGMFSVPFSIPFSVPFSIPFSNPFSDLFSGPVHL